MDKQALIKALRDTAQSASNAIASNVSGPVDLLAAGLRMGGLNVNNPMGGSQWMQERGLTREVEMGAPRIVGETLGMAGPALATQFAPKIAGALNQGIDNAMAPATLNKQAGVIQVADDYRGAHRPPMKDNGGAPLNDLTGGGNVYPDDIYSSKAAQYYGTGDPAMDRQTMRLIQSYKNNPDSPVSMYRAVPKDVPIDSQIRNGDWVTINPQYAKLHGESVLNGEYNILKQQVPARKLFTNGDSIHEFGYDETGKSLPALLGLIGLGTAGGAGAYNYMQGQK